MLFKAKCDILDVYVRFIDSGGFSLEKCGKIWEKRPFFQGGYGRGLRKYSTCGLGRMGVYLGHYTVIESFALDIFARDSQEYAQHENCNFYQSTFSQ